MKKSGFHPEPTKENETTHLFFCIDATTFDRLNRAVHEFKLSRSEIICNAINYALDHAE